MPSKSGSKGFEKPGSKGIDRPVAVLMGLALMLLGTSVSSAASAAGGATSYSVRVPVVSSTPILSSRTESVPERICKPVQSRTYSSAYDNRYGDRYNSRYTKRYSGYDGDPSYRGGRGNNIGGQILGGIIGGAVGNQFGRGNGRKALTIAGALVGSSLARDAGNGRDRGSYGSYERDCEPEYVCRTSTVERVVETVTGYEVTYEYNGALHVRNMSYDPGEFIELRVTAEPLPSTETQVVPSISSASSTSSFRSSRRTL